ENPEEIHQFANSILREGKPLPKVLKQGRQESAVWMTYETVVPIEKAELNYTLDSGRWQDRKWESIPATIDAKTGRVTAQLPAGVTVYYFNVFDNRQCAVSSPHEELRPSAK
ncbi:MAG: dipeptidyl aminopeptidase, partial [Planctomycetes bacterium]|nr:dipeptidyl aminopeptidase [Planctomycetota bacterium]